MVFVYALVLAFALDVLWGEPAARWHPVVWMGRYLRWAGQGVAPFSQQDGKADWRAFWRGAGAWLVGAALVALAASVLQTGVLSLPLWLAVPGLALCFKPMFSWRLLHHEVRAVEAALAQSLTGGRARLAMLVSRDVTALTAAEVRESAIESLAENLNDSVVAPIFWFVLLGLPGAAVYRFANTADAMWGYRGAREGRIWEWAGKWAAHADDALSWLPARITAIFLLACAPTRWHAAGALRAEAAKTPSPNSGWPMAAMALALQVRLCKPGVYVLNEPGRSPDSRDTDQALKIAGHGALMAVAVACTVIYWLHDSGRGAYA